MDGWKIFYQENNITEDYFNEHIVITDVVEGVQEYINTVMLMLSAAIIQID